MAEKGNKVGVLEGLGKAFVSGGMVPYSRFLDRDEQQLGAMRRGNVIATEGNQKLSRIGAGQAKLVTASERAAQAYDDYRRSNERGLSALLTANVAGSMALSGD